MSRNEIRLRRQRLTASGANRFRNYGDVLQRHEKEMRIKKIVRVFTMFAIILILVMVIIILLRTEKKYEKKNIETAWTIMARKDWFQTSKSINPCSSIIIRISS